MTGAAVVPIRTPQPGPWRVTGALGNLSKHRLPQDLDKAEHAVWAAIRQHQETGRDVWLVAWNEELQDWRIVAVWSKSGTAAALLEFSRDRRKIA